MIVVVITDVGQRYIGPFDTAMLSLSTYSDFPHWDISL